MKQTYIVILLLIAGFALRLYDLTDLPLDFHPTRQLLSLIKARGMYYAAHAGVPDEQRRFAIDQWHAKTTYEPEILERLVVFTYRFTGEQVWIGRIYSSLFWTFGAIFLYWISHELVSESGALLSLTFYLFLPYGVIASRSFQPDPLMLMLVLVFWWTALRWSKNPTSWFWSILAGSIGGLAILAKFVAAFFVIGGGVGTILSRGSPRETVRRPQVWVVTALGILPGAAWTIYGVYIADFLSKKFEGRFIPSLLLSPSFYLSWISMLNVVMGGVVIALGLLGLLFFREKTFVVSIWIAYLVYGIFFDYHISTHDYYSLILIPLVAFSLAPFADLIMPRLDSRLMRLAFMALVSYALFATVWSIRSTLNEIDYRPEAAMWSEIGQKLGPRAKVTALAQDYGARLEYWGWKRSISWPVYGDFVYHADLKGATTQFDERFAALTAKSDFFLVTLPQELVRQPELQERLASHAIFAEGDGYIIYDLR